MDVMENISAGTVDLVLTSPPFALRRSKSYGNVPAPEYVEWFLPFAKEVFRILKPRGSFVFDIGGSWNRGEPTRNLYHFDLLLKLCDDKIGFNLAQEFYWYNPAKIPNPAQWVTVKRIRVKDAVTPIWWLSKSKFPKASNRRVLKPYSKSMEDLLKSGYNEGRRPSGHVVSSNWDKRYRGAIPSNLIIASNTRSNDPYLEGCKANGLEINPARFVVAIPEFFIKFLTLKRNVVLDPFCGSNVVGAVAERLGRKWLSVDINLDFVLGSAFRFGKLGPLTFRRYSGLLPIKTGANE